MRKIFVKTVCFVALALSLASCVTTKKNLVYLQDMSPDEEYPVIQKYETVIQRDDKLSITVSCKDPELALAFNIPGTGGYEVQADGTITSTGSQASDKKRGYIVDSNGNIEFPILGLIHVEGLTRNQLVRLISNKIKERQLITDPIVMVDFLSFKISVLGEVSHVGTFDVSGDRITLLDAIAMAGDLTKNARVDRVAVIREVDNKRRVMWNDLRTKDLFMSPSYYLQQNDIIYVEPNEREAREQNEQKFRYWQYIISSAISLTSIILYFTKK